MNDTRGSVEPFDLNRHAVVEASAGTGKTYTIEQLVHRLLTEEPVTLDQILIVTFTEKATGDLKTRLRTMLDRSLQKDSPQTALLKVALDQFDQAPIFTIHGFCQRLLQEYALEQGQDFRADLVNDVELLRTLLREIQRKHWRTHFGPSLKAVLEKARYQSEKPADWERKVVDIAAKYKPRCDHQLRPAFTPDWWQRLDEADTAWVGQLEIFTIDALHQRLRDYKRQRGLQSFDDMIAAVEESLDVKKNADAENLLLTLRKRFRYGIVDEFQDTDPLQWRIFRRIFLDGGASRLFVVGDPKQAIFGFRGADLPTYLHAAEQMRTEFGAVDSQLPTNWRSDPDLLEALNCLFEDGGWFPRETGIRYIHVDPPDPDQRQSRIEKDETHRAALTIVDTSAAEKLSVAHKQFARFVVAEIQALLAGDADHPSLVYSHKGKAAKPIDAGDICVLVFKKKDADPILDGLDAAGIPYSFYKQAGLWQSDAATHLDILLQSLARPEDRSSFRKALLTCFFRIRPEELVRAPDVPAAHPARQLYQTWLGHAENRQWSSLCRSLLEDTGLLFQAASNSTADRMVALLRHLLTALEQVGHGLNLDLIGLLDWLHDQRAQRDVGDADLHPVESDAAKVKIMTIHASKGLEFPIVFLAGGFTQNRLGAVNEPYRDDQQRLVFDLFPDGDAHARVGVDRLSGHRRLLYVALTRAIFKLYVPKVKISRSSPYLGPLGTVLEPALEQACPDKLGDTIAQVIPVPMFGMTQARVTTTADHAAAPKLHVTGALFPAHDAIIGKRRIVTRSFSSMTKHHLSQVGEGSSFGEQLQPAQDEAGTAQDREDPLRGPVFGDMVHNVLEAIDFAEVGRATTPDALTQAGAHARKLIDREVNASIALLRTRVPIDQLEHACRQQIADLVWHALRTPLTGIGSLCDIPSSDRLPEIEFLYPEHNDGRIEERFITGFMDLLFRKEEKYYLVDWKTNLLPGYSSEQIERSMSDSDYHRQYRLYLQAVSRWLTRGHDPKKLALERFGGVYYLYVRGLNGRDDSTGVFFHRPTSRDLDLEFVLRS